MMVKLTLLPLFLIFVLLFFTYNSHAEVIYTCQGNWDVYMPSQDAGNIRKSDRINWKYGDYPKYNDLSLHRDKFDFVRENYLSIDHPHSIERACKKYGPPYYILETGLPGYIFEEIKKYKCHSKCKRKASVYVVSDARDLLAFESDSEGFFVDCQFAYVINVFCNEKTDVTVILPD